MSEFLPELTASQVVSEILKGTDVPVPPENIQVSYRPERGTTWVEIKSAALKADRRTKLALRTAIGHTLAVAVNDVAEAKDNPAPRRNPTLGHSIEMGPPQDHISQADKIALPYRDPKENRDLTLYFPLIDVAEAKRTFSVYYASGHSPDSINPKGGKSIRDL